MRTIFVLLTLAVFGCQDTSHQHDEHDSQASHSHGSNAEAHSHDQDGHDEDDHGHGEENHGHDEDEHGHAEEAHGHGEDDHGHAEESHGHGEDDHGHGEEGPHESITLWGETAQLFVEFPFLVVGQDSHFAAHLTRLSDHFAVDRGRVTVELTGNSQAMERFSVEKSSQAGIFRPVVTPAVEGPRNVRLRLESDRVNAVFELGTFTVFADEASAKTAEESDDHAQDAISFLLEQQWKIPFRVEKVTAKEIRPSVPAFGKLKTPHDAEATIRAPGDGRLRGSGSRFPHDGQTVTSGETLFVLGITPSQDDVDPATLQQNVEAAEIDLEKHEREYERIKKLADQGIVEARALENAELELKESQAELRGAKNRVKLYRQNETLESDTKGLNIPSPIDGTIAEIFVAPNVHVSKGQELLRMVNRDSLWVDVDIPAHYAGLVRKISGAWFKLPNMPVTFELDETDVLAVSPEIDSSSRTLPVLFAIENVRGDLYAGMTAEVHVIIDQPILTIAVPYSAIVDVGGMDVVFVQTGGERFEKRTVRKGVRDGDWIEILEGIKPGEWVVAEGAYSVKLAASNTSEIGHGHAH